MYKKILFGLIIILFSASCSSFEDIEIGEIKGYTLSSIVNNELKIDVKLNIKNPTLLPITIKELDVRTQINGRYIGKVNIDKPLRVLPKSDSDIEIPVTLKISNVFVTAFVMLSLKNGGDIKIDMEGSCKARSMFVTREVEIKESFDFEL